MPTIPATPAIMRSPVEINEARNRAQVASFNASDNDLMDDAADAVYAFCQWLFGDADEDPTVEMAELADESDADDPDDK
jgi:hypothetical protein